MDIEQNKYTSDQMIKRRERLLGPAYRLFYDRPLNIVRGEGVWLFDCDGNRYLDMYNNVAHVGHCHPHVVQAIKKQVGKKKVILRLWKPIAHSSNTQLY